MGTISELRESPIAGMWYSGDPVALAHEVDGFITQAIVPPLRGEVVALVAPHAGHRFSGKTAGYAFRCVKNEEYDVVVVVSPMHGYARAPLLTSAHKGYETPLGPVWIEEGAVRALHNTLLKGGMGLQAIANDDEHSLEIELPFLQRALGGGFSILPVMVHSLDAEIADALGRALATILHNQRALLVASTDLSHYYTEAEAKRYDEEMLRQIEDFSPEGLFRVQQEGRGFACGLAAVAAVLTAARVLGADHVEILHHSTSADSSGDRQRVVGYGAAVALRTGKADQNP
jgi:AmmeMemoRadiSam system protein B